MIGIPRPTRFNVPWEFVESLVQVRSFPVVSEAGSLIDENRNKLMKKALDARAPFLLMIDPDMTFTLEDVDKIVGHMENGLDIVSGLCRRGEGGYYAAGQDVGDGNGDEGKGRYATIQEFQGGLTEVGMVGAAFLAINKQVIEKMQDDPFRFITINGEKYGEDVFFCEKARELGFKVWVDSSIRIGHIRHSILY